MANNINTMDTDYDEEGKRIEEAIKNHIDKLESEQRTKNNETKKQKEKREAKENEAKDLEDLKAVLRDLQDKLKMANIKSPIKNWHLLIAPNPPFQIFALKLLAVLFFILKVSIEFPSK